MKINHSILFLLIVILISCKTIKADDQFLNITTTIVPIGSVIDYESTVSKNSADVRIIPNYGNRIKLSVLSVAFNKKIYNNYKSALAKQFLVSQDSILKDTLQTSSNYIYMSIQNKLEVIEAMNGAENKDVFEYSHVARVCNACEKSYNATNLFINLPLCQKGLK